MEINGKNLLLALMLMTTLRAQAASKAEVAQSQYWRRLLHAEPAPFDPLAVLEANLAAFAQPPQTKVGLYQQHPQCVYPERFRFLKAELGLPVSVVDCPEFKAWKDGLAVRSLTLVYASPYLGHPASMFGHTFLRLGSAGHGLAAAGLSFDAMPASDAAIVFAWKGLTGGYSGQFSLQPYYSKIKNYSHLESRDLWEYELDLEPEQIDRLVAHLWELGSSAVPYYFIHANCSYQLLSLLEVANPAWHLRDRFKFMAIPLDTVRAVESVGAVRKLSVRPSLAAALAARYAALSPAERQRFASVRADTTTFSDADSVATLDALIEWQRHQTAHRSDGGAGFHSDFESRLLLARSKAGPQNEAAPALVRPLIETPLSPASGHRSSKLSLHGLHERGVGAVGVRFRPALHDRLEYDRGYIARSSLIAGELGLLFFPTSGRLALDSATLVEVLSLRPMTELQKAASWQLSGAIDRPLDAEFDGDCHDCVAGRVQAGFGAALGSWGDRLVLAAMANMRLDVSNGFQLHLDRLVRVIPGVGLRALIAPAPDWKFELTLEQGWVVNSARQHSLTNVAATVAYALRSHEAELRLGTELALVHDQQTSRTRIAVARYF